MLTVFALRYGAAVHAAFHPQLAQGAAYVAAAAALSGLVAGFFGGRAAALVALTRDGAVARIGGHVAGD